MKGGRYYPVVMDPWQPRRPLIPQKKKERVAGGSSRSIELFRDASKYTYESELQGSLDNALLKNNL
jgi:hypothetical protein